MQLTAKKDSKMPQINSNSLFTSYTLTESETRMAHQLSPETEMLIQNLICDAATDKVNLPIHPDNYAVAMRDEAYLRGQLHAYKHLLALSQMSKQEDMNNSDWSGIDHGSN